MKHLRPTLLTCAALAASTLASICSSELPINVLI